MKSGRLIMVTFTILMLLVLTIVPLLTACAKPAPAPTPAPTPAPAPAPAPAPKPKQMDEVTFRHTWVFTAQLAPWFLGREKGWFADEGIDLEILEGKGSSNNAKLLATGSVDISLVDSSTMLKSVTRGMPLQSVFGWLQLSPQAVLSPADAPIKTPKELEGKTLVTSAGSSLMVPFPALMKAGDADIDKVNIVNVSPGAVVSSLLTRKGDAALIYTTNNPPELKAKGLEVYALKYSDFGLSLLSAGVVANTKTIEENPDLVQRFVRATQKSISYTISHPEEATDIYLKYVTTQPKEVAHQSLLNCLALVVTPNTHGKPLGWMAKADWELTQDILYNGGVLDLELPVDSYFTNEFVPE